VFPDFAALLLIAQGSSGGGGEPPRLRGRYGGVGRGVPAVSGHGERTRVIGGRCA
jgi:hypothetical protein